VLAEAVPGPTLTALVRHGDPRAGDAIEQAGAVLGRLHAAPPALAGGRPARDLHHELDAVSRIVASVAPLAPEAAAAVNAVRSRTAEISSALPPPGVAFVHGDYKADHLILGPTTTLIDFDRCGTGDPALDVAKFLADLRWWAGSDGSTQAAEERFLAGYHGDPATVARARGLEPLWSVKLAGRRLPVHEAGWAPRLRASADAAERRLEQVAGAGR
jgi:Ser/Thr protein kinase RdoA (MazF antagonist)